MHMPHDHVPAPDWTRAVCRDHDPELFFPVGTGEPARRQTDRARSVCLGCPVRAACANWALDAGIEEGVWGGHSPAERRLLRRPLNARRAGTSRTARTR
jgi:WhiB family redox-sensing transcriptional regulator